ncbi:hypothetical protein CJF32_00000658 [Rutstroemia sp. NJR-2017a WRK4]|nr:hypothetical protein CJF32_00000658 [Rutstroemia sp. NJR-2017a WRK4]
MDQYFNFDDASHPSNDQFNVDLNNLTSTAGLYDIGLAFANPEADEDSFTCLQHFTAPEEQLAQDVQAATFDTSNLNADDFTDFPRWIDGMTDNSANPCTRCRKDRTHCKIIREGFRKGSCTSCVALARSCSLTYDPNIMSRKKFSYRASGKVDCAADNQGYHTVNEEEEEDSSSPKQCEYCRIHLQPCKVDGEDGVTSCGSCLTLNRPCSLVRYDLVDWRLAEDSSKTNGLTSPMSPFDGFNPYSGSRNNSSTDLLTLKTSNETAASDNVDNSPKVGARFSRQSVRILKDWLGSHHRHPYPTDAEREVLMSKTGLNKTQITNWLANARRRGKSRPTVTPPTVGNYANAMDIPRRATPALENMNPLERWKHSPPEHEPASALAIAQAVTSSTFSSGVDSPYTSYADDGSNRSLCNVSSTSSLGTSHSSAGSFASVYSHRSRGSFGSFGSFGNKGRRRRRRQAPRPAKVIAAGPPRTFQCTFCTESFKTKHDWQRHEKSLHLSLERWICCPEGPTQFSTETNQPTCVYCSHPNPQKGHAEMHNHSSCAEKPLGERTFYRKDHLRQHLHLVHDVKFVPWGMESWKAITPEIRSRCGFCGIVMESWTTRVDHLAEHFKGGRSMADWKGDWGFEPQILNIVENGMPPYLIHEERNTMRPFEASQTLLEAEPTLENLIKSGLIQYLNDKLPYGITPTDAELVNVARQIIRNLDAVSDTQRDADSSWLRDLILASADAQDNDLSAESLQRANDSLDYNLMALQKSKSVTVVHKCPREQALREYVISRQMLGLTALDSELQAEACRIIDVAEKTAIVPCKGAATWLKYLINNSTAWLADFRRRAGLPRSSEMKDESVRPKDDKTIDHSIHNYARLETELKDYVQLQATLGIKPTDSDIQRHARMIIYGSDDPWNQTWADNVAYLQIFKSQNGLAPLEENMSNLDLPSFMEARGKAISPPSSSTLHWEVEGYESQAGPASKDASSGLTSYTYNQPIHALVSNQPSANSNPVQPLKDFCNDANCYNRLVRELSKFVARCMSPNNPSQHIPSDEEIQNQARWVIYDDDDPWNQTAADNAEWLLRFKRDVGLAPANSGPGLPTGVISWQLSSGGSGFCPPYVKPGKDLKAGEAQDDIELNVARVGEASKVVKVKGHTVNGYINTLKTRYQPPAQVFCSRELEDALCELVNVEKEHGRVPSDEMLRAKAREVLKVQNTAADDEELLAKFKNHYGVMNLSSAGDDANQLPSPLSLSNSNSQSPVQPQFQPQARSFRSFSSSLSPVQQPQPQSMLTAAFSNSNHSPSSNHSSNLNSMSQIPAFLNDDELLASFDQDFLNSESFDQVASSLDFSNEPSLFESGFPANVPSLLYPTASSTTANQMDFSFPTSSSAFSNQTQLGTNENMQMDMDMEMDMDMTFQIDEQEMNKELDYASLHRVSTATASPWRRRASERLARGGGGARGGGRGAF